MSTDLLTLDSLSVDYTMRRRPDVRAVRDVSLTIREGETYALIGESGSGKSTISKAILGLQPIASGDVRFAGQSITGAAGHDRRRLRRDIQAVFQDPHAALNPRMTMVRSVAEPLRVHGVGRRDARRQALEALERVGIDEAQAERYPHQLSGGQKQRVNIARALVLDPRLVICDEAVSALDVSLQAEILNLLRDLQREARLTYLFITHDISLLPHVAERVGVLYLGRLVEEASTHGVVEDPTHPYTRGLVASVPDVEVSAPDEQVIRGEIPDPSSPPSGCTFHPRCPYAVDRCRTEEPELQVRANGRLAACHRVDEGIFGPPSTPDDSPASTTAPPIPAPAAGTSKENR